jgi:MFS family permease
MKQINKFYLSSFLKNQIYFVPIIVLFFQDLNLNYTQIFWIFTLGSAFAFLIEIPTGIFADFFGNRRSIIISKLLVFISFIFFGFAFNFWSLLLANLIYELGKSFRSGTETAYVFNYLKEKPNTPSYILVKANQKFYARISESLGALVGGYLAYKLGFSWVFFIAAIPAFVNFLIALSWEHISESGREMQKSLRGSILFAGDALRDLWHNQVARSIVLNISFFAASFAALDKFVQPYMKNAGLDLQYFGPIYAAFLIIIAFLVRFASRMEAKWGGERIMNYSGLLAFIPLIILGTGISSLWAVGLFFLVLMIANFRSPVANNLFHEQVSSKNRATMGSILALFESLNKLWILPIIGYLADWRAMSFSIFILAIIVILNAIFFWIPKPSRQI